MWGEEELSQLTSKQLGKIAAEVAKAVGESSSRARKLRKTDKIKYILTNYGRLPADVQEHLGGVVAAMLKEREKAIARRRRPSWARKELNERLERIETLLNKISIDVSSLLEGRKMRAISLKRFAAVVLEEYKALRDRYGDAVPISKLYEGVAARLSMNREDFDMYLNDLAWVSDKVSIGMSRPEAHVIIRARTVEELVWR